MEVPYSITYFIDLAEFRKENDRSKSISLSQVKMHGRKKEQPSGDLSTPIGNHTFPRSGLPHIAGRGLYSPLDILVDSAALAAFAHVQAPIHQSFLHYRSSRIIRRNLIPSLVPATVWE
jgi:hypothetical protein